MSNKVHFEGNLCQSPTVQYTENGKILTTFTLASDEYIGNNKKEPLFMDCLLMGKEGEKLLENHIVGRQYIIDGRLIPNTYIDKKTKQQITKTKIIINNIKEGYIPQKYVKPIPSNNEAA